MGARQSKRSTNILSQDSTVAVYEYGKAPSDCVHHYLPSNFPMNPTYSDKYLLECNKTWKLILAANTDKMRTYGKSGLVLMYDEYYFRLFQRDTSLERVFPNVAKRSEIIVKMVLFILKSDGSNPEQAISKCNFLGHRHRSFSRVRAYQFHTISATLVEVIMYWLGELATHEVGKAWCHSVAFFTKHILEAFLYDKIDPFETYQNTVISAIKDIEDFKREEEEKAEQEVGKK